MFSDPEKNIKQFSLAEGSYVADFGSGSGFYSFAAAEAIGSGGRVYSLDIQKDLLEKIKREAQFRHLSNIEIIWADLEHVGGTKLRESSIDSVILANILFQLENKEHVIMEIKRVLKRGGRVLVIDWLSSFGGLGPQAKDVLPKEKAQELFIKNGFSLEREMSAGAQHYGLIFRK
ncbi:MAG: methyltransferase domain-containing protein [Candidatus Paceibacterota bacterium]|jgi:ubiquinone/menaquinone biosynthesis C-methylase UbiE